MKSDPFTTERMNKRLLWTTAALLTTVGIPLCSQAEPIKAVTPSRVNTQAMSPDIMPPAQPIDVVAVGNDTSANRSSQIKVASIGTLADLSNQVRGRIDNFQATNAPVWRATAVAAKLNQLNLDKVDASKITAVWKAGGDSANPTRGERYLIKVNGEELVEINPETRLPDQTKNLAEDALQVTNRLRRLLGNAAPLR